MIQKEIISGNKSQTGFIWENLKGRNGAVFGHKVSGVLILDMDGTLTAPKQDYAIEPEVIPELADFLINGGNIVLNTGATTGRIERTLLNKLYFAIDEKQGMRVADSAFKRLFLNPENGSALLTIREIMIEENELFFDWNRIHELHVPNKTELRSLLEKEVVPMHKKSYLLGDWTTVMGHRDYIVTLKKIENTLELKKQLESDQFQNKHPEIDWKNILIKAARTSVDFIHKDSGKTVSVDWLLREMSLSGPVVGFGDLGDEFAKVIPTFNVNLEKPNEFRIREMPAMDIVSEWLPLKNEEYVITGTNKNTVVRNKLNDNIIPVLRDNNNIIIYSDEGNPWEIKPLKIRGKEGEEKILAGAGKSTAWMIHRLVEVGYFSSC